MVIDVIVIKFSEVVRLIVSNFQLVMNGDVLQRYQHSYCFKVQ